MYYLTKQDIKDMKNYQKNLIKKLPNVIKIWELYPTDSHTSFYGKAKVIECKTGLYLLSYNTLVCFYSYHDGTFIKMWDDYSATTMRHINVFMQFIGLGNLGGKKWWTSLECDKKYFPFDIVNWV